MRSEKSILGRRRGIQKSQGNCRMFHKAENCVSVGEW